MNSRWMWFFISQASVGCRERTFLNDELIVRRMLPLFYRSHALAQCHFSSFPNSICSFLHQAERFWKPVRFLEVIFLNVHSNYSIPIIIFYTEFLEKYSLEFLSKLNLVVVVLENFFNPENPIILKLRSSLCEIKSWFRHFENSIRVVAK